MTHNLSINVFWDYDLKEYRFSLTSSYDGEVVSLCRSSSKSDIFDRLYNYVHDQKPGNVVNLTTTWNGETNNVLP